MMAVRRRLAAASAAACLVVGGCGATPEPALPEQVATPDGAIRAAVPSSIGDGYVTRDRSPVSSEGIAFYEGDQARLRITASASALREFEGASYADPDLVRFRELVWIASRALPVPDQPDGCVLVSTRPIQRGPFYGQIEQWEDCSTGPPFWARIAALRADRAVTVTVEAWMPDATAAAVASTVLAQLSVDPARLPEKVDEASVTVLAR
jgi:hypothetical protein